MKNINKLFLLVVILITTNAVFSQSFEQGSMVADVKTEIALYNTESKDKTKTTNNISTSKAASKIVNMSFEYGITNWLGVGFKYQHDSYFVGKDTIYTYNTNPVSVTKEIVTPTVKSNDFSAIVNAHFLRSRRVDMFAGLNFGFSSLKYERHSSDNARALGSGTWFDLHLTPRFYFGDHFGMNLNIAYTSFNYASVVAQSTYQQPINAFSLKGGGINLGIGLQYKIK